MVHVIAADKDAVQECISQKRVICFGAGRRLEYFRGKNPHISIAGIIDNYKSSDCLETGGVRIPIWFPEEAVCKIDGDTVIVITSIAIEEIVDQMDKINALAGIPCYVEAEIDDYAGLGDEQRQGIKALVSRLAGRTRESILKESYGEANLVSDIKKYQTWEYINASYTAGSKARMDIKRLLGNMGYQAVNMHCRGGSRETDEAEGCDRLVRADWEYFLEMIPKYSIVFMQLPAPSEMRFPRNLMLEMKEKKHIRFACFIHDVDSLRKSGISQIRREEFGLIKEISDFLVVHNDVMRKYFESAGIKKEKITSLEIFDYLHEGAVNTKTFEKTVIFAGNLRKDKSSFLDKLGQLSPLNIRLYGPGFSDGSFPKADNVSYCGSFPAEELPQRLDRGFGLVWDGDGMDTCSGGFGEYLRYNNPHKLSLYLASGLPVIIWDQAAEAEFVIKNKVGITVSSLYEINAILDRLMPEEYSGLAENARKLSDMLKIGEFTKKAVRTAEAYLGNLSEFGMADGVKE